MRLVHVSDWHLGRVTYGQSRQPDHVAVLDEIAGIARDVKPHLIVHTGDLYDTSRPAYPDMQLGINALRDLSEIAPVVVVRGNHDSAALFRVFNLLLGDSSRIQFVDQPRLPDEGGILDFAGDGKERIRVACLPFIHANRIIEGFENPASLTTQYANRIAQVEEVLEAGLHDGYSPKTDVLIFAAHLFVVGAIAANSERQVHVGNDYATHLDNVPQVSYAAFGHIHRPQKLPGTTVAGRYAGSPIPLDFGEEGEQKQIVVVEAFPGKPATVTPVDLHAGRQLRKLEGTLDYIRQLAPGVGDALCLVTVKTDEPERQLAEQIRSILPDATLLAVNEDCAARKVELVTAGVGESGTEPSLSEAFLEYLAEEGTSTATVEATRDVFARLIAASEAEEEPHFDVLSALIAAAQPMPAPAIADPVPAGQA